MSELDDIFEDEELGEEEQLPREPPLPSHIAAANARGDSPEASRADHTHAGVASLEIGDDLLRGDVEVTEGDNIELTTSETDRTIEIATAEDPSFGDITADSLDVDELDVDTLATSVIKSNKQSPSGEIAIEDDVWMTGELRVDSIRASSESPAADVEFGNDIDMVANDINAVNDLEVTGTATIEDEDVNTSAITTATITDATMTTSSLGVATATSLTATTVDADTALIDALWADEVGTDVLKAASESPTGHIEVESQMHCADLLRVDEIDSYSASPAVAVTIGNLYVPGEFHNIRTRYKSADETINNDVAPSADVDMQMPIEASSTYQIDICLYVTSTTNGDFRLAINGPGGGDTAGEYSVMAFNHAGNVCFFADVVSSTDSVDIAWAAGCTDATIICHGIMRYASAGNGIDVRWAQANNHADNLTMHQYSYVKLTKLGYY